MLKNGTVGLQMIWERVMNKGVGCGCPPTPILEGRAQDILPDADVSGK